MTEINTPLQVLIEKAENYSTTSIQLIKLNTISTVSNVISTIVTQVIIYLVFGVFILFCNIALALWLGEILGKAYLGFVLIGSIYGLITLVLYIYQTNWLKIPFQNIFISKLDNQ